MIIRHVDGEDLRKVMRVVPAQVVIVTARFRGRSRGITINSFNSVSLSPPLISFNVHLDAFMYPIVSQASHYAVHILDESNAAFSAHFARPELDGEEQFRSVAHTIDKNGIPLIMSVGQILQCRSTTIHTAGDHAILVGEVVGVIGNHDQDPLIYYDGAYYSLGQLAYESAQ